MRFARQACFVVVSFLLFNAACSAAAPKVTAFLPSVGWAGTTAKDGTLVRISGNAFSGEAKLNSVYFHPQVAAQVLDATPDESQYNFLRLDGGPGTGPGSLNNPIGLALDAGARSYVVNVLAKSARIEVFDANGQYQRQVGESELEMPWGVALDAKGNLYVTDRTPWAEDGFTQAGQVVVFTNAGQRQT